MLDKISEIALFSGIYICWKLLHAKDDGIVAHSPIDDVHDFTQFVEFLPLLW